MTATNYAVVYGHDRQKTFDNIQDAAMFAREKAVNTAPSRAIVIFNVSIGAVIGLATNDANGLVIHRLESWPKNLECAYQ